MPILTVKQLNKEDVYTDSARINEKYRIDENGTEIPEGRVCKVYVAGRSKLLSLRGDQQSSTPTISLDDVTRGKWGLRLQESQEAEFRFRKVSWFGQFLWAWRAANPAYRITARIGLVSVILGVAGLILGAIGLFTALKR